MTGVRFVFRVAQTALLAGLRRHPQPFVFPDPKHPFKTHIPALADQLSTSAARARTGFP